MSTRIRLSIVVVAVGLAGTAATVCWRHGKHVAQARASGAAEAGSYAAVEARAPGSEEAPAPDARPVDSWAPGERRTYAVTFGSKLVGNPNAANGSLAIKGTAELELTAATVAPRGNLLQGRVSSLSLAIGDQPARANELESSMRAELGRRFMVKMKPGGQIESVSVDREVRGLGFNVLRAVVAALSFTPPDGRQSWREWTATESDQNGILKARYRETAPGRFTKAKDTYSYIEADAKLSFKGSHKVKLSGQVAIERDDKGIIRQVEVRETEFLPLGDDNGFRSESQVTLGLTHVDSATVPTLDSSGLAESLLYADRAPADSPMADQIKAKRDLLAGGTLDGLVGQLREMTAAKADYQARAAVSRRLTALFDLEPKKCAAVHALLKGAPRELADMLLGALSDSSTPEAQRTLAQVAADEQLDASVRQAATIHLGLQEKPSAATFTDLANLADPSHDDDTRRTASLAMGSASYNARASGYNGDEPQQAVKSLVTSLQNATTPEDRSAYLAALGNSGAPEAFQAVASSLADPEPSVRAAAAASLRFMSDPSSDHLIVNSLTDSSELVRSSAMTALSMRPLTPDDVDGLASMLKNDSSGAMRLNAVSVLGGKASGNPAAVTALEGARDHDPSADVREAAARVLGGPTMPPGATPLDPSGASAPPPVPAPAAAPAPPASAAPAAPKDPPP